MHIITLLAGLVPALVLDAVDAAPIRNIAAHQASLLRGAEALQPGAHLQVGKITLRTSPSTRTPPRSITIGGQAVDFGERVAGQGLVVSPGSVSVQEDEDDDEDNDAQLEATVIGGHGLVVFPGDPRQTTQPEGLGESNTDKLRVVNVDGRPFRLMGSWVTVNGKDLEDEET